MKEKLIKHGHSYALVLDEKLVAFAHPEDFRSGVEIGKLSLKNCQAIERGYDLDKLALHSVNFSDYENESEYKKALINYKEGFQKALEVNADKRFTLKEMVDCWNRALEFQTHKETLGEYIKSLKQTEWDVEVVEVRQRCHLSIGDWVSEDENGEFPMSINGAFGYRYIPKLDADGCLILKRI